MCSRSSDRAAGRSSVPMFPPIARNADAAGRQPPHDLGPVDADLDLLRRAASDRQVRRRRAGAPGTARRRRRSPIECGVGETLVEDTVLLHVHGATQALPERALRAAIRLATARAPSSRIPNMPSACWWISPSGRCRPPSMTRRRRCRRSIRSRTCCGAWAAGSSMPATHTTRRHAAADLPGADLGGLPDAVVRRNPAVRRDVAFRSCGACARFWSVSPRP